MSTFFDDHLFFGDFLSNFDKQTPFFPLITKLTSFVFGEEGERNQLLKGDFVTETFFFHSQVEKLVLQINFLQAILAYFFQRS